MRNNTPPTKLIIGLILTVFFAIISLTSVGFVEIEGSERVVWQTRTGVSETSGKPGLNIYYSWFTTPHVYYTGSDTFVVDHKAVQANNGYMTKEEKQFNEPDAPPIVIPVQMDKLTEKDTQEGKTTGPTNVSLSCVLQYHLSPEKVVKLHNEKTKAYRTNFIKDILMTELIEQTTILDARTIYQGSGRVALQKKIQENLKNNERFKKYGVVCEKFVIRGIEILDKEFLNNITEEARAEQERKTAAKQEVAYQARAKAEKARALQEQNRRLVEAETKKQERIAKAEGDKQEQILAAEAEAEQVTLAAKAEKEKIRLAAEAQKEKDELEGQGLRLRKLAEAEGVLALGKAEAEAKRLSLAAYLGEGGRRYAQVEIAKAMGEGIEKIYWVPADMNITSISKDFQNAIAVGLPNGKTPQKTTSQKASTPVYGPEPNPEKQTSSETSTQKMRSVPRRRAR